jgi:hypothetical protein
MGDIDKSLEKVVDDHLKRIYDRYKSNTKLFTATHVGHISLSIVFLFSILFPFLYLQIDTQSTDRELERLSQRIQQQEQRGAVYRQALTGLQQVFEAVQNTPQPLEGYIKALQTEATGGPEAPLPAGLQTNPAACGSPQAAAAWMECRIQQYMAARASQYTEILKNEVAAPLQKLGVTEFDQWKTDLQVGTRALAEQFRKDIAADPAFWRNFNQNSPLYRRMMEGADRFWADHKFEEMGRKMEADTDNLRGEVDQLNQKQDQIRKRQGVLSSKLKNIKTRFGKIGMELSDAILIAPIVFAALFVFAVFNLSESFRLRKSFQTLFQAKDPQKIAITDSQIALTLPLWVDPLDPPVKRKMRLGVLMIPAIAAALTLLVIAYCRAIPGAFPGLTGVDFWKYLIYYLLSAGLFIYGFRRIQAEIKNYGSKVPVPDEAVSNASTN